MPNNSAGYGPQAFQREFNISDDTRQRLEIYTALLHKWQPRINLISKNTLPEIWWRHLRDSAQLISQMQGLTGPWFDLGSGAGFPGLVLALIQADNSSMPVILIESDQRKAIFLNEVIRATGASAKVHAIRSESINPKQFGGNAGLITARALAPLHELMEMAAPVTDIFTVFLLLKGQDVDGELTRAAKYRKMTVNQHASLTNPAGRVLRITEVARV